jgi:phosphatidylinositol alpha-1,6-mannosyltransferase
MTHRIDVVHSGDLFPQGPIALLLKRFFGLPYIAYCHGDDFMQCGRYPYQARVRDLIYRSADVMIANSTFTERLLLQIGVPAERLHKITPGVDCDEFSPASPDPGLLARYGLRDKFVLLTVARLVLRKGHDAVMQAVARLHPAFPHLRYLIVGSGPNESRLRQLAADLGISAWVSFAGFVPQSKLPDYYRLSDVMVMPNREENADMEGFGMTFLEASACGKAVIAGRSGGAPEAVGDGLSGRLVDPTDLDQVTAAIRELLDQPRLAAAMGAAGLRRARTQFDWKLRAAEVHRLTRQVAARCGR